MSGYRSARKPWTELFPAEDIIYDGLSSNEQICIVDVGGGFGHDLALVKNSFQRPPQRLLLQDRSYVLDNLPADLQEGIEAMSHDFWKPQPIEGARAYLLKSVLHDWPDPKAVEILKQMAAAMKPGYSKLIILENIIPAGPIPMGTAGLDAIIMANFASCERTERQWRGLLKTAGLKIRSIHRKQDGDGLIEAVLQ